MLEIRNLTLAHDAHEVVTDLTLDVSPGEVTALVGPNGVGKSTLLRALFGEHRPRAGEIRLDGTPLHATRLRHWQSRIGYMPQENRGRMGLTALETVLAGSIERLALHVPEPELRRAAMALDQFGLAEVAHRSLDALSGGQRQLVYFAQALLRDPRVMLLDEPVSALDLRHQHLLMEDVRRLCRGRGMITVVVLHDLNLAARFADRLVVLGDDMAAVAGPPTRVLDDELLRRVYGVEARVGLDEDGYPWVQVRGARRA
ncbi:MAG: ABC transporter ATP-binding protein [Alphaproteobacteria bacterium]|nr:ABC transporter ATP-binding protein [Alphaproteobacteria bacterium]